MTRWVPLLLLGTLTCAQALSIPDRRALPNFACPTPDFCACVPPFADCDASPNSGCETDTSSDDANCGGCGIDCGANGHCQAGACVCDQSDGHRFAQCSGAPCNIDLGSDPHNCGACGNICAANACTGGVCNCKSASWPDPPTVAPNDTDVPGQKWFAMRRLRLHDPNGHPVGFDLDGDCRGCGCPQVKSKDICVPYGTLPNEVDGGIDNQAARVVGAFSPFFQGGDGGGGGCPPINPGLGDALAVLLSTQLEQGDWSLLLRLRNYNGTPDDANAAVAIFTAKRFAGDPCHDSPTDGDGLTKPKWDGTDVWPLRSDSFKGAPSTMDSANCGGTLGLSFAAPRFEDAHAYVTAGKLVATWPEGVTFYFAGDSAGVGVNLTDATIVADLQKNADGSFQLDNGVIAGAWPEKEIFKALGGISRNNEQLCTNHPDYPAFKCLICDDEDIRTEKGGPTSPCDAMSFGIGFDAVAAQRGTVQRPSGTQEACPPAYEPANDGCSQ